MLDLAGRPLDLAAEVHTRGSEDLQVMDGIHHMVSLAKHINKNAF